MSVHGNGAATVRAETIGDDGHCEQREKERVSRADHSRADRIDVDATRGVDGREDEIVGTQKSAWYRDADRDEAWGQRTEQQPRE